MRKLNTPTINWREMPLVRLILPFVVGIYLGEQYVSLVPIANHSALGIGLALLFYISWISFDYGKRWLSSCIISLFLILLGIAYVGQFDERKEIIHFWDVNTTNQLLVGEVTTYPKETDKFLKATVHIKGKYVGEELIPSTGSLLVYLKKQDTIQVDFGDQLFLNATIQPIRPPTNPLAFNFKQYSHFQNVHYQSFVASDKWFILQKEQAHWIAQTSYNLQGQLRNTLQKHLVDTTVLSIVSAMTLGYKTDISEDLKAAYAETGVLHVLAVSGLHVGILSELLLLLLGLFRRQPLYSKRLNWLISLFVIWGFAFMVGSTASVIRAAIMFSFLNFARIFRRDIHPLNSLAAAALFILIIEPYALFQLGFQFSFLAVVGILLFYKPILYFWMPNNRLMYFLWQLTVVGISAQLMVLPLSVYYFHQMPMYSWLAGLLVVPLASVILYLGLTLLAVSFASTSLAKIIAIVLTGVVAFQNQFIYWVQALPNALWKDIWITPYEVVILYGAVACILLIFYTKKLKYLMGTLAFLLLIIILDLYKDYKKQQQYQLVVYDAPNESLVDFVSGNQIYTLQSPSLMTKHIYFAANNFRMASANTVQTLDTTTWLSDNLFIYKEYIQFGEQKMVVINPLSPPSFLPKQSLHCDYLLIQNTPHIQLTELQRMYDFKTAIFDSSNNWFQIRQWKKECEDLALSCYFTREEGAYLSDIFPSKM